MALKIIFIILVMFAAFLLVYGFIALIAVMLSHEHRHVCGNCVHFDQSLDCCWKKFQKSGREDHCENFKRIEL